MNIQDANPQTTNPTVKDDLGLAGGIDFSKMPMGDKDMEEA